MPPEKNMGISSTAVIIFRNGICVLVSEYAARQHTSNSAAYGPRNRYKGRAKYFIILKTVLIGAQRPYFREKINMHIGNILRPGEGPDYHIPERNQNGNTEQYHKDNITGIEYPACL